MAKAKFRIVKDYKRSSNAALLIRATVVHSKMSDVSIFPNPPVAMDDLKISLDQLDASIVDAQHRDRLKAAHKNAIIEGIVEQLDQLANYAISVANDDEAILLSSGFAVSGATGSVIAFGEVENFSVEVGPGSGNVSISVNRVPGARAYTINYGIANGDNTVWNHMVKARSKFVLKGLQPGKTYLFVMNVTGTNDKETQSETITKIVA